MEELFLEGRPHQGPPNSQKQPHHTVFGRLTSIGRTFRLQEFRRPFIIPFPGPPQLSFEMPQKSLCSFCQEEGSEEPFLGPFPSGRPLGDLFYQKAPEAAPRAASCFTCPAQDAVSHQCCSKKGSTRAVTADNVRIAEVQVSSDPFDNRNRVPGRPSCPTSEAILRQSSA